MKIKYSYILIFIALNFSCSNMLGDIIAPVISGSTDVEIIDVTNDDGSESVIITWNSASDESVAEDELTYIIVFTDEDPSEDVSSAISSGTVLGEITDGTTNYSLDKIEDGISGYVTIIVSDSIGNYTLYTTRPYTSDINTSNELDDDGNLIVDDNDSSSLNVAIILEEIDDLNILFSDENDLVYDSVPVIDISGSIVIQVSGDFDEVYSWYLNNELLTDVNTSITISPISAGLSAEFSTLLVILKKDNHFYSSTFKFQVTED